MRYRWWLTVAAGLFVVGLVLGLVMPDGTATDILTEELAALKELGTILGPFQATTVLFIFVKNVVALLFSFIFSPVLCLIPVLTLLLNAGLLSFISAIVIQENSLGLLLAGLLPHGIFEIPAIIIGEAAALSFGAMVIITVFSPERRKLLLPNLKQNLRYLAIACVLLVPAAIIETYLTPLLLR